MGLMQGARSFFALISGQPVIATEAAPGWEPKTPRFQLAGLELAGPEPSARKAAGKSGRKAKQAPPSPPAKLSSEKRRALLERGARELLILFQREGRLIDFLTQEIDDYDDETVGAAVREIHKGCARVLDKHVGVTPVFGDAEEDDEVTVPKGFNPEEMRLIGKVKGKPPFKGVLTHAGWRASKMSLPEVAEDIDTRVLAAAEVEL
jgi:hypothetical protein